MDLVKFGGISIGHPNILDVGSKGKTAIMVMLRFGV